MGLLSGKTALVMGVANRWSIATHIAKALHEHGARLALTYEGERTKDEVEKLAPAGFEYIEKVLSRDEREAIVKGYAGKAGFALSQVNK